MVRMVDVPRQGRDPFASPSAAGAILHAIPKTQAMVLQEPCRKRVMVLCLRARTAGIMAIKRNE